MIGLKNFISRINIPFLTPLQVFFDLGTSYTRIAISNKGIVLREPTYIGINNKIRQPIFFGKEAKSVIGKTPDYIKISRPLINAIISDFDAEVDLIKYYINKSIIPYLSQHRLLKPTMVANATYPMIATEIEQKAVEEVLLKSGCTSVNLFEKPLVTAIGCGININSHQPQLIVDLGGGLIEISIVSGGGIVSGKSLKMGGEHMDKIIANYIYLKHGVILGEATVEKLKLSVLNFIGEEQIVLVRGKSLENGLPKSLKIRTSEIREALLSSFGQIIESIKEMIEASPPEIVDEVFNVGIILTGGLANIRGIDKYFSEELKIKTVISGNCFDTTISGLMHADKIYSHLS